MHRYIRNVLFFIYMMWFTYHVHFSPTVGHMFVYSIVVGVLCVFTTMVCYVAHLVRRGLHS